MLAALLETDEGKSAEHFICNFNTTDHPDITCDYYQWEENHREQLIRSIYDSIEEDLIV
jgi:hypothetical protein